MHKLKRKLLSQNFLHSRYLVSKLVKSSSIGKNDLVLEIGPGKGIITEYLLKSSQHVIAVELDSHWCDYLQEKFRGTNNLTLYQADIMSFDLPKVPFKVFANIPFAIEGKIIRKLIDSPYPPEDCYLVVMKELAFRISAPHKENQFSLIHKPWFDFSITHHFKRSDFTPFPSVDAVLFRFRKKPVPLLPEFEKDSYEKFICHGFGKGLSLGHNLDQKVLSDLGVSRKILPNMLPLEKWVELYQQFKTRTRVV